MMSVGRLSAGQEAYYLEEVEVVPGSVEVGLVIPPRFLPFW